MSSTAQLLLQLIVILATARVCGWVLRFVGQPAVIGEMIAGLLLGPVVFGALFPQLHAELFPKASLEGLSSLSTLGLVMFMFVVGLETKTQQSLRDHHRHDGSAALADFAPTHCGGKVRHGSCTSVDFIHPALTRLFRAAVFEIWLPRWKI
jgi:K+:H+ antiporter